MVEIGTKVENFKANALVKGMEKEISLADFKGKKVALYFYPKDLTPGCTTQACNISENYSLLEKKGIVVIGVSKDPIKLHQRFVEKKELKHILISDEELKVHKIFDTWKLKKFMGREYMGTLRETFLIDEKGVLVNHIVKPKVKIHSEEIISGFES